MTWWRTPYRYCMRQYIYFDVVCEYCESNIGPPLRKRLYSIVLCAARLLFAVVMPYDCVSTPQLRSLHVYCVCTNCLIVLIVPFNWNLFQILFSLSHVWENEIRGQRTRPYVRQQTKRMGHIGANSSNWRRFLSNFQFLFLFRSILWFSHSSTIEMERYPKLLMTSPTQAKRKRWTEDEKTKIKKRFG